MTVLALLGLAKAPSIQAQAADGARPAFEVASVKPMAGPVYRAAIAISGTRVSASGPVKHLIELAYNIKPYQLTGGPGWADDSLYAVEARAGGDGRVGMAQARLMMQTLLAERFRLALHSEKREIPVYNLVIGKDGPKLKSSAPGAAGGWNASQGPVSRFTANISMVEFCRQLSSWATDRPVLDETGLAGVFQVDLKWSLEENSEDLSAPPPLATAVQEQLGLRLAATKAMADVMVIDSVARPSEN